MGVGRGGECNRGGAEDALLFGYQNYYSSSSSQVAKLQSRIY